MEQVKEEAIEEAKEEEMEEGKEEEMEDIEEEVKDENEDMHEEGDTHDTESMHAHDMSLEEKKILSEGHARCFLKRIFAIYAEHRPTVPIDEVVETVEQAGDELEAFYMALCTVHGLRAGLPTWEPPDDRPDWMPEFLMRDGTGRVPDLVAPEPAVVAGEGPMDARPKPVPKPKVVIRPARVPYTPAAKAAVPEPNAPVLAPPPPPPPAPPRLVPLPPPRPVHTPVAWWPAPPPPPAAKPSRPRPPPERSWNRDRRRKAGSLTYMHDVVSFHAHSRMHAIILAGPSSARPSTTTLESKSGKGEGLTSSVLFHFHMHARMHPYTCQAVATVGV